MGFHAVPEHCVDNNGDGLNGSKKMVEERWPVQRDGW